MTTLHPTVAQVTRRIRRRSHASRQAYLDKIRRAASRQRRVDEQSGPRRQRLSCSNLAHGFAACGAGDKAALKDTEAPNIGIVTAYNDMLSAHQPFEDFPRRIKDAVREVGAVAQVAGGVPAMCDGVTQGFAGMELSLWSRDVIALSTAIALSHDMFDGAICLGVCDKIIPGLLIGALSFGHLPVIFTPAGPMPSGLSNQEKARVRQLYAEGKIDSQELLAAEAAAYHAPGTCTFYGTANSNQMFMELMGLHLPGASFPNPGTPLREALTAAAARRVAELAAGAEAATLAEIVDERAIVNAVVGLLATGGSTNHTIHLPAIARAAGILIDWQDFDELSAAVPLLARVYPNGPADVNHFHAAGGLAVLIGELIDAGLVHPDVRTVAGGDGLHAYRATAAEEDGAVTWRPAAGEGGDDAILRPASRPFQSTGGLRLLTGNLGRAVVKTSAVRPERRRVAAPAIVFEHQEDLPRAFAAGELDRDFVAVVRFQGPRANGMPELHKLMPALGVLQDRGFKVALVTDGRLSGASGKVTSAIHVSPEAAAGGALARLVTGDPILIDPDQGVLSAGVDLEGREPAAPDLGAYHVGLGRELFSTFRAAATGAEEGAMSFGPGAAAEPPAVADPGPEVALVAAEEGV